CLGWIVTRLAVTVKACIYLSVIQSCSGQQTPAALAALRASAPLPVAARDRAPSLLIGVDPVPAARKRALELGADLVFAPDEIPEEYGTDFGNDPVSRSGDRRPDVVLEATGVTPGLGTAGALVRPFGTLCIVGYHHAGDAMMDMRLWYKAVTIVNGFCPDRTRLMRAMSDALDLIARRRFSYAPLVTHRFGLDQVDQAYELMDARADGFVKAVLTP
ncbi:MAG TPA: zinc-binding dehydrogenase, partial [Streptosporangiaceae bacterium]|nr:zinc-binding dehydrogenase [Streptosporangiaceae bacterium]